MSSSSFPFSQVKMLSWQDDYRIKSLDLSSSDSEKLNFTVIIGINGTGKSRLLGNIANTFIWLRNMISSPQTDMFIGDHIPFINFSYTSNGSTFNVFRSDGQIRFFKDGVTCRIYDLDLPPKVIALTVSPFDKFPLPRNQNLDVSSYEQRQMYSYLGSRSKDGRAGASFILYNALENLSQIRNSRDTRRGKLLEIFSFLGYKSQLRFKYLSRVSRDLVLASESPEYFQQTLMSQSSRLDFKARNNNRLARYVSRGMVEAEEIRNAIQRIESARRTHKSVEVEALITPDGFQFQDGELLEAVVNLRRAGLLQLDSVKIEHASGRSIDLLEASSGELSILTSFLGLSSSIEDGSIILIDEPELSLHPEWQSKYLDMLQRAFADYLGCHFILATHSPMILAEAPPDCSSVVTLDHRGQPSRMEDLAGQSSDYILVNAFKTANERNYYVRDLTARVMHFVSNGDRQSKGFRDALFQLSEIRPMLEEGSYLTRLIDQLENLSEEAVG